MIYIGEFEYRNHKFRNYVFSKMAADTLEELHKMADFLGVSRKHFQNKKGFPHYDIVKEKKEDALRNGAILTNDRVFVEWTKQLKWK